MTEDGRRTRDEKTTKKIRTVRDLIVYRKAFDSAMEIFEFTKNFPCIVIISMKIRSVVPHPSDLSGRSSKSED